MGKWTEFMDMHSGGGAKEKFEYLYIEASRQEAEIIFQNMFGHNPNRVTCTCCGQDYSVEEYESLEEATAFKRGCKWDGNKYLEQRDEQSWANRYKTVEDYIKSDDVRVIYENEILPEHRIGDLKSQGYIWVD